MMSTMVSKKISVKMMTLMMLAVLLCMTLMVLNTEGFASTISGAVTGYTTMTVQWPWERFIGSLADQLSGPLPRILGILGIVGAAVALFAGNGGAGTQKFIMLIFAISIALFAPSFIKYLNTSAGSITVNDVYQAAEGTSAVIQSALLH